MNKIWYLGRLHFLVYVFSNSISYHDLCQKLCTTCLNIGVLSLKLKLCRPDWLWFFIVWINFIHHLWLTTTRSFSWHLSIIVSFSKVARVIFVETGIYCNWYWVLVLDLAQKDELSPERERWALTKQLISVVQNHTQLLDIQSKISRGEQYFK